MSAQSGYRVYGASPVKRWTFGVKAGVNISDISNYSIKGNDYNSKVGIHFGGTADYLLTDNFHFQPSLLLSLKGAKVDAVIPADTVFYESEWRFKETVALYYLDLPLMFAYRLSFTENFSLDIQAGPTISIGLFGRTKSSVKGQEVSYDSFVKKYGFNRTDFGLGGGVTAELFKHYRLGISYTKGLSSLQDQIGSKESPKNTNIAFSLSYMF